MFSISLFLAVLALVLAALSFVPTLGGYPLLAVAVILLAIAVIV
jgi:hypothetical protein